MGVLNRRNLDNNRIQKTTQQLVSNPEGVATTNFKIILISSLQGLQMDIFMGNKMEQFGRGWQIIQLNSSVRKKYLDRIQTLDGF